MVYRWYDPPRRSQRMSRVCLIRVARRGYDRRMQVKVKRSSRRHKTVQARLVDGVLHVAIPDRFTDAEERHWVRTMERRFRHRQDADRIDLADRARRLVARYRLPSPQSIEWSGRQSTLWGSCTISSGKIRISRRAASFPRWVLDYIIVHELAHLVVPNHNRSFWKLVGRYELAERARGYLIAKAEDAPD